MAPSHTEQWGTRSLLQYNSNYDRYAYSYVWSLVMAIMIVVVLEQLFLPVIIFFVLLCRENFKEVTQKHGDQEIVTRFRDELTQFDKRHPVQTPESYSPEMLSEIADIEKRLESVVDNLRAQRRRQKAARKRTVYGSRVVSCHSYVSSIIWLVYVIISSWIDLEELADLVLASKILSVVLIIIHYFIVLIESFFCKERRYITNLSTVFSAVERISQLQNVQPNVHFSAECYHYERRTRTVAYTDSRGHRRTRTETYMKKVVTANISEPFIFRFWRDHSQAALVDIQKKKVTKVKLELQVLFGDAETAKDFDECYSKFKEANKHRDTHVDFSVSRTVPGFDKRLAAYVDASAKAWWINSPCFWLSTVFWLGWIYRSVFNYSTAKTTYDVIKLIYVNRPIDNELQNTVDNGHMEPPDYCSLGNSLTSTKSNIEALLKSLETSGDEEDNMPLKLVNDAELMHIALANRRSQLQEATVQTY